MILVDKEIQKMVQNGKLIKEGYEPSNLNSMSYDLTVDTVIVADKENQDDIGSKEVAEYSIAPGEYVYIKTKETLSIPVNILGRIAEKNSIMRMGLVVSGPHYQPGHITNSFLRVQNISPTKITIKNGRKIAQIIFEQLQDIPDKPYCMDERASFNNEFTYKGFGKYKNEYQKSIDKLENINNNIEEKVNNIYANIITLMGIFISIFSLITVNFELFSSSKLPINELLKSMVVINTSLGLVITFILGIITIITNRVKSKKVITAFFIVTILLIACNIVFLWIK